MSPGPHDGSELPLEIIDLEPAAGDHRPERDARPGVPRRRGPVVVAIIVVVALVVSVVASRSHHHDDATGATTTDPSHQVIRLHGGGLFPFRIGAQTLTAGDDGLRLIDTDTGAVGAIAIAGLPPGSVTIVASSLSTVAVRALGRMYWFTLSQRVAHFVNASTAFAAVELGHLWLAGDRYATEVPGDPTRRVATANVAIGATRRGLLEQEESGYTIQPTGSGASTRFLPAGAVVIGVHPDRVAWVTTDDCGALRCPVHVTEVASGATSSWIQLAAHPDPIALADTVAYFEPDGGRISIVVPDNNVTQATTMLVADLHTKQTRTVATTGYVTPPARPGTTDAAGATIAWTADGSYLLLAPAVGISDGRLAVVDPDTGRITAARVSLDLGASAAVTGDSTLGGLTATTRPGQFGSIAPDDRPPAHPGLQLAAADSEAVEVLDLATNAVRSIHIGGPEPNSGGPHSFARVTGGWLVVRGALVELIRDGESTGELVDAGTQVYAANDGRTAWLATGTIGGSVRVETYDPATGAIGAPFTVSAVAGAVDAGLVVPIGSPLTRLQIVDASRRARELPVAIGAAGAILAAGGSHVVYDDADGLSVLDVTTGATRVLEPNYGGVTALSADGNVVAWVRTTEQARTVVVLRLTDGRTSSFASQTNRVLVANDGTVLAIARTVVSVGQVGTRGLRPYDGLSPATDAELALG